MMMGNAATRIKEFRQRRNLGGGGRAGRYARRQAWDQLVPFVRRLWWLLILIPAATIAALTPFALGVSGFAQGAVVGGAGVSGVWLDVLVAIVWTGAAVKVMGVDGETSTAEQLRTLNRQGWHLVNGLRLTDWGDIDHIAVGPGGVLVVESKWSGEPWPLNGYGPRFMQSSLDNAASQVGRNAKDVADWVAEVAPEVPITPIVVLWSASEKSGSGWATWRNKRTVLVHGPDFRRWLRTELPPGDIDVATVERLWTLLRERVEAEDQADIAAGRTPPPTLLSLATEWVIKPTVGFIAAVYGIDLLKFAHNDWAVTGALILGVALGLWMTRFKVVRRVALGWLGVTVSVVVVAIGAAIVLALR